MVYENVNDLDDSESSDYDVFCCEICDCDLDDETVDAYYYEKRKVYLCNLCYQFTIDNE